MSILGSGFANNCLAFLDQAPQPPSIDSVQAAMSILYNVGAVESHGDCVQPLQTLTSLGAHPAKLPVDVKLGKMLIYGALFRCIDPILTIAASLSTTKSPFSAFANEAAAKAKQRVFFDADSDFMTYCNVWHTYSEASEQSTSAARKFCNENYLNFVALREIGDARRQFLDLLCNIGFVAKTDLKKLKTCRYNQHAKLKEVVHAVICAGLYPNVAYLEQSSPKQYSLWQIKEHIYFHKNSVNATKKHFSNSERFVLFHEKFGTQHRTSVSTTAFVHPFALILFGGLVEVKHTERTVVVDSWMNIGMAAQTGVLLREIRTRFSELLQRMIEGADANEIEQMDSGLVDGIIKILNN